ncbi:MAG: hypothetical protein HC817_07580 [Saprospiraceae bacterium]|nr:hypothetical protein [Saprospiraceae bacterium]
MTPIETYLDQIKHIKHFMNEPKPAASIERGAGVQHFSNICGRLSLLPKCRFCGYFSCLFFSFIFFISGEKI